MTVDGRKVMDAEQMAMSMNDESRISYWVWYLSKGKRMKRVRLYIRRSASTSTYHKSINFDLRCARRFVVLWAEGLETSPQTARRLYAGLVTRALGHFDFGDMVTVDLAVGLLPVLELSTKGLGARRVLSLFQEFILHLDENNRREKFVDYRVIPNHE